MKKVLFLFLLLPLFSFAQEKGDNQIIVSGSEGSYKKTAQALLEKGYTIEKSDENIGHIVTGFKRVFGDRSIRISVFVRENKVTLTGLMGVGDNPTEASALVIKYNPSKALIMYKAWPYMEDVARLVGTDITYARK